MTKREMDVGEQNKITLFVSVLITLWWDCDRNPSGNQKYVERKEGDVSTSSTVTIKDYDFLFFIFLNKDSMSCSILSSCYLVVFLSLGLSYLESPRPMLQVK